jgi:AraC-like DNA-binding protein
LNRSLGQSFHKFLNSHRIAEARQLLKADRASSALSIGYHVGFNSKSTFYAAFKQAVGMSPSEYRKRAKP